MTEKEAASRTADALRGYEKLGPETKRILEDAIPAIVHIQYLAGLIVVPRENNA